MVERWLCKSEVVGSIPTVSIVYLMMFNRTEQFQLVSLVPLYVGNLDLSVTNRFVYLIRTFRVVRHFATLHLRSHQYVIPTTGTLLFEAVGSFAHGMTSDQVGSAKANHFYPLVLTIFLLIVGRNRMGMIPHSFPRILRIVRYLTVTRLEERRGSFFGSSSRRSVSLSSSSRQTRGFRTKRTPFSPTSRRSTVSLFFLRARLYLRLLTLNLLGRVREGSNKERRKDTAPVSRKGIFQVVAPAKRGTIYRFFQGLDYPTQDPRGSRMPRVRGLFSSPSRSTRARMDQRKKWKDFRIKRRRARRALRFFSSAPSRFTPTSHLGFTFRISSSLFVGLLLYRLERHRLHFFSFFFPRGIPFRLAPFIVLLERISFFFRPVSLGVRLAANMTAGHLLLHTVRGFVSALLGRKGVALFLVGRAGRIVLEGVFVLETRVCFLQAYVFTALFTIYLKDAEELH